MLRLFLIMSLLIYSQSLLANPFSAQHNKVIYGNDDRIDVYEANLTGKKVASSVVALVSNSQLKKSSSGNRLQTVNYGSSLNLCKNVRFYSQPTAANCSGVVIGSKHILTAGHCANHGANCSNYSILLDFDMNNKNSARTQFNNDQVYRCKKVAVNGKDYNSDWMIVELDRKIIGAPVVRPSTKSKVGKSNNNNFTLIGHPTGLPKKIAANGHYIKRHKKRADVFYSSVDSYHGNSGSPVFNTQSIIDGSPEIEGVLVEGNTDFISKNGCKIDNICEAGVQRGKDDPCEHVGEGVTDIRYIIKQLGSRAGHYFSSLSVNEQFDQQQSITNNYNEPENEYSEPSNEYNEPVYGGEAHDIDEKEARQLFNF